MVAGRNTVYRFGDCRLDSASGELSRNGSTVRLQPQPLQFLLALLDHPGRVISREELQNSLWSESTNVQFEDGLNHAVRRLRDALGDTAQVPTYVETIPRRGYRLIVPVEIELDAAEGSAPGSSRLSRRLR